MPSRSTNVGVDQAVVRVEYTILRAPPAPVSAAQVDSHAMREPSSLITGFSLTQPNGVDAGVTVSTVPVVRSQRWMCSGAVALSRAAAATWRAAALPAIARFCTLPPEASRSPLARL